MVNPALDLDNAHSGRPKAWRGVANARLAAIPPLDGLGAVNEVERQGRRQKKVSGTNAIKLRLNSLSFKVLQQLLAGFGH